MGGMGCDIHLYAEQCTNLDGRWEILAPPVGKPVPWRFGRYSSGIVQEGDPYERMDGATGYLRPWFDTRHYRLFALLANVRNYDQVEPFARPRGVPEDASPDYKQQVAAYGPDGHSHSYATVAELLRFFEDRMLGSIKVSGVVSGRDYEEIVDRGDAPESWSGGISGMGILVLQPADYDRIRDKVKHEHNVRGYAKLTTTIQGSDLPEDLLPGGDIGTPVGHDATWRIYVECSWQMGIASTCGNFLRMLGELRQTSSADDENTRIVFFFDN